MWKKVLGLCLISCLLVGCAGKSPYVNLEQDSQRYVAGEDHQQYWNFGGAASAGKTTRAEAGYYYYDHTLRLICYCDLEKAVSVPLCDQPECDHDDGDCNAYVDYKIGVTHLQYYYGYLYVIGNEDGKDACVYRVSKDGSVREKIGTIVTVEGKGSISSVIHRGYAYYGMDSGVSAEDGMKIYRLCLSGDQEAELIYTGKSYAGSTTQLGAYGNYLYIKGSHLTADGYSGDLLRYQIHDGEVETVAEDIRRAWTVGGDTLYYDTGMRVLARDLESGAETVLAEPGMPVYLSCDGRYLICDNGCGLWLSGETYAQRRLFVYDCQTGEVIAEIALTQEHSELIGTDGENIIAMIPAKQAESDAYDTEVYFCRIADAAEGLPVWHGFGK